MAEVRELIAKALVGQGNFPWAERVVETGAMTTDTGLPPIGEQPWLLVRSTGSLVNQNRVEVNTFEVSIYAANTSFSDLDVLEKLILVLLNRTTLIDTDFTPNRRYTLGYSGTLLGDQVVTEWDAYVRVMRFDVSGSAQWYQPDDPRAKFLRSITPSLLFCQIGTDWSCVQTDPRTWTPTDQCPGVYWRPDTGPVEINRWFEMTQYVENIAGHVLAGSSQGQDDWVDRVALAIPGHVLYDQIAERRQSTMLLRLLSTDIHADALNEGQIRLEVIWTELACDYPPRFPSVKAVRVAEAPSRVGSELPPLPLPVP